MKFQPRRSAGAFALLALAALALPGTSGCGYGTNTRTAKDIKTIYVPFFENKTAEPNLEISVTNQIIQNLVSDNTLKVVPENNADAVLDGEIVAFKNTPFGFDPKNLNAEEYHVVITVECTLFNRRTNQPVWEKRSFVGDGSYFVEKVEGGRTFTDAVNESLKEITDRILNLTVQDW